MEELTLRMKSIGWSSGRLLPLLTLAIVISPALHASSIQKEQGLEAPPIIESSLVDQYTWKENGASASPFDDPDFPGNGPFLLTSNTAYSYNGGNREITILSVRASPMTSNTPALSSSRVSVSVVPEPGPGWMAGGGMAMILGFGYMRLRSLRRIRQAAAVAS